VSARDPNEPPFNLLYADGIAARVARGNYGFVGRMGTGPIWMVHSGSGIASLAAGATSGENSYAMMGHGLFAVPMHANVQNFVAAHLPNVNSTYGCEIHPGLGDNGTIEYVPGGNRATNPFAHTIGTTPSSFFRVRLRLFKADAYDQLAVGWRKQQAFATTTNGGFLAGVDPVYTDFAALGIMAAAANPAVIRAGTDLNDTGTITISSTGFSWPTNGTHELEVRIVGNKAQYLINGCVLGGRISKDALGSAITAQPTNGIPTYTFDSGDLMIPFIFIRCDTGFASGYITLEELEVGRLADIGLDNQNRGGIAG
jgi:hypothetical protein